MAEKGRDADRFVWKPGDVEIVKRGSPPPEGKKELTPEEIKALRGKYRKKGGKP